MSRHPHGDHARGPAAKRHAAPAPPAQADAAASGERRTPHSGSLRCDPIDTLVAWAVLCSLLVIVLIADEMTLPHHDGYRLRIAAGVLAGIAAIGVRANAWLRSYVAVDARARTVDVRRLGWWGFSDTQRSFALDDIAAVVLGRGNSRLIPLRLAALRTKAGGNVLISTIGSSIGLIDEHAARIANLIGCDVESVDTLL
ncbi:MAG: hypothetical protein KIT16_12080 [Rhodospirillaceae bacterium]|nr:hypothetical protein [Rhodospirillaceae bacterium]